MHSYLEVTPNDEQIHVFPPTYFACFLCCSIDRIQCSMTLWTPNQYSVYVISWMKYTQPSTATRSPGTSCNEGSMAGLMRSFAIAVTRSAVKDDHHGATIQKGLSLASRQKNATSMCAVCCAARCYENKLGTQESGEIRLSLLLWSCKPRSTNLTTTTSTFSFEHSSMSSQLVSTRLKYLNDSAHLLSTSSQSTAAFIMSQCNNLMFESNLDQTDSHQRQICGACGNIMLLGATALYRVVGQRSKNRKRIGRKSHEEQASTRPHKSVVIDCDLCGKQTRQTVNMIMMKNSLDRKSRPLRDNPTISSETFTPPPSTITPQKIPSTSANANSRKRAKVRKQGGLQALLAASKENKTRGSSGGFGLDLMDMMKRA
jgi:ribonuclease MRP protein subunit SNM1